jgi:hypothetical protein
MPLPKSPLKLAAETLNAAPLLVETATETVNALLAEARS